MMMKNQLRTNDLPTDFTRKRKCDEFNKSYSNNCKPKSKRIGRSVNASKNHKRLKVYNSSNNLATKPTKRGWSIIQSNYDLHEGEQSQNENKKLKLGGSNQYLLNAILNTNDDEELEPVVPPIKIEKDCSKRQKEKSNRIPNLTQEQDEKIKQIFRDRKKMINSTPILELKEPGIEASLDVDCSTRYPIFFPDIEEVLTHLQNNLLSTRWMHVRKASHICNTLIVNVEGPGLEDYQSEIDSCPSLKSFKIAVEFVSPLSYGDNPEHGFALRLNSQPGEESAKEGFQKVCAKDVDGFIVGVDTLFNIKWNDVNETTSDECSNIAIESEKSPESNSKQISANKEVKSSVKPYEDSTNERVAPVLEDADEENINKEILPISLYKNDKFSRLSLVLTARELANAKFPLPFLLNYQRFVKTKDEYTEVNDRSPMFGLDCEMCQTRLGSELTRISVVNEKHEVVYEKLVKPYNKIIDYVTQYSGITPSMLKDISTRLHDVQNELKCMLPSNAILVGHSLNSDLAALKMMHPYVIDTSIIFNLTGYRHMKTKLATLSAEFLSEKIQDPTRVGHDSIEDAVATLKLAQAKLQHSIEWGDAVLGYKRTMEDSQKAQILLLEKEKMRNPNEKPRLAYNGSVDDSSLFEPPFPLSLQSWDQSPPKPDDEVTEKEDENPKLKIDKEEMKPLKPDDEVTEKEDKNPKLKIDKQEMKFDQLKVFEKDMKIEDNNDSNIIPDVKTDVKTIANNLTAIKRKYVCNYKEVTIIGSQETLDAYKQHLPKAAREKVNFIKLDKSSAVIKKLIKLDSEKEKQVIIAHIKSAGVSKVEAWSTKLLNKCNQKDFICLSLCGSKDEQQTKNGVFLASIPLIHNLPPIKEVINKYLESGIYNQLNT